jgi:hypothetical protein
MSGPWIVFCGAWLSIAAGRGRARRARRRWFLTSRRLAFDFIDGRFAEKAELVVERAHVALLSALFAARLLVGMGPRSMIPFSAKSRRTVSDG